MKTCANCQTTLSDTDNFCSECGQNTKSHRQPFPLFMRESLHELLDIDGRLMLTLKTLLLKPGLAAHEYQQGKRQKYTPPLRLYLVFSLLFFLLLSSFLHLYSGTEARPESTTELYSRIMFVLLPIYALYVKLLYRHSYYMACLVFAIHLHCVAYLVLLITATLETAEQRHLIFVLLQVLPAGYFVWYVLQAFKTMFQESWRNTLLKSAAIYFVYMSSLGLVFDVMLR
ncbi:zinc ribbon domain-containing protein [Planctobacterium marinum]|uniref:zinc ribbon domain-containing protein n=1 Tax=Planctobacterium marinum TaxID=1631968 RepID=UPI001E2E577C|nr:zinc ribbon domain-containing protein [Planctobacterium marinum]